MEFNSGFKGLRRQYHPNTLM